MAEISHKTVKDKTGKDLSVWFALLDSCNATELTHREIAALLRDSHRVSGWWSQMLTVVYERERGMRERYQRHDGWLLSQCEQDGK